MRTTTWAWAMPAVRKRAQAASGINFFIVQSPRSADRLGRQFMTTSCGINNQFVAIAS
jgi:hypothetical protein